MTLAHRIRSGTLGCLRNAITVRVTETIAAFDGRSWRVHLLAR